MKRRRPSERVPLRISHGERLLAFDLVRTDRRTLGLTVKQDGSVVARAPRRTSEAEVVRWVARHADWIEKKQQIFAQRERTDLRYVDGERHLYLGRQYLLAIEQGDVEGVRLEGGRLRVTVGSEDPAESSARVKDVLEAWYLREAKVELSARLAACWATFPAQGRPLPVLRVKRMCTRWGSMSPRGSMSLRLDLVRAPAECIDYVIVHELCHLLHPHHGPRFWALVEQLVPDWRQRKRGLERLAL